MTRLDEITKQKKVYLDDLFEFLRIPSITRDKDGVRKAAEWLLSRVKQTASSYEIIETEWSPVLSCE